MTGHMRVACRRPIPHEDRRERAPILAGAEIGKISSSLRYALDAGEMALRADAVAPAGRQFRGIHHRGAARGYYVVAAGAVASLAADARLCRGRPSVAILHTLQMPDRGGV